MEWIKVLTKMRDDPDIIGLSNAAFRSFINGLLWVGAHETDGKIPRSILGQEADELAAAGIVDVTGDTCRFTTWKRHQITRKKLETKRRATRKRVAEHRKNQRERNAVTNAIVPTSTSTSKALGFEVGSKAFVFDIGAAFDRFWSAYPRHDGGQVKPREKFAVKVKQGADPEAIIGGAERYRDDPNREEGFTALAMTWLNQERWDDPPLPQRQGSIRHHDRAADIMREAMK